MDETKKKKHRIEEKRRQFSAAMSGITVNWQSKRRGINELFLFLQIQLFELLYACVHIRRHESGCSCKSCAVMASLKKEQTSHKYIGVQTGKL